MVAKLLGCTGRQSSYGDVGQSVVIEIDEPVIGCGFEISSFARIFVGTKSICPIAHEVSRIEGRVSHKKHVPGLFHPLVHCAFQKIFESSCVLCSITELIVDVLDIHPCHGKPMVFSVPSEGMELSIFGDISMDDHDIVVTLLFRMPFGRMIGYDLGRCFDSSGL